MDTSKFIKVYTGNFIIAQRIVFELKEQNIIAIVKDATESARLAGFGGGIVPGFQEIYVNADELDTATALINSLAIED